MSKLNWTDEMIALLKELYPNETIEKVASLLGVGKTSVKNKATELGLERGIKREWLEKVEEVRKLNSTHSISEIADKVGISERTVSRIKAYLNLIRIRRKIKQCGRGSAMSFFSVNDGEWYSDSIPSQKSR